MQLNTTLVSLELNSNSIDYDGATALAEAISENNSLTSLYLRCKPPAASLPSPHIYTCPLRCWLIMSRLPVACFSTWSLHNSIPAMQKVLL